MSDIAGVKVAIGSIFGGSTKRDLENEVNLHNATKTELGKLRSELDAIRVHRDQIQNELDGASERLAVVRSVFDRDDGETWVNDNAVQRPTGYERCLQTGIPIILFANLKGGVGKTTLAANLATFFEVQHGERVLVIDLDFQGSLSSMLATTATTDSDDAAAGAMEILSPDFSPASLMSASSAIRHTQNDSRVITCGARFAAYESKLSMKWLLRDFNSDLRYHLAALLLSDEVQNKFDRVIIDAPPRNTTALINALCASNFLVIPTVLDRLSTFGVSTFLADINRLRGRLFPELKLLGVIGTMKRTQTMNREKSEIEAVDHLKQTLKKRQQGEHLLWEDCLMPRMEIFAKTAGVEAAYHQLGSNNIIDKIGARIADAAPSRKTARA